MIELLVDECSLTVAAAMFTHDQILIERRVPIPRDIIEGIMRLPEEERFKPLSYWFEQFTRVF